MATTGTREVLSASTGLTGAPIAVVASGTLDGAAVNGTLVHTATSAADTRDEVFIYAHNFTASSGTCVLQWGGTDPNQHDITVGIAGGSTIQVIPGFPAASGMAIRAYGSHALVTATGLRIEGWVNRLVNG